MFIPIIIIGRERGIFLQRISFKLNNRIYVDNLFTINNKTYHSKILQTLQLYVSILFPAESVMSESTLNPSGKGVHKGAKATYTQTYC